MRIICHHSPRLAVVASLMLGWLLFAQPAAAASVSWGQMMCDFTQQNSAWAVFVSWIAYITGTAFIARAIYMLKMHWDDAARNPLNKALFHALAGAMMLVFPGATILLVRTIFGTSYVATGGGTYACTPGIVAVVPIGGPTTVGLDVLAQNFVNNVVPPGFVLFGWFCFCFGAYMIYRGLNKLAKYNTDPRAYAPHVIIANLFIGALLMAFGSTKDSLMATVFGIGAGPLTFATIGNGTVNWAALGVTGPTTIFDNAFIAAMTFFQLVGLISFIRGWLLMKAVAEGTGNHTIGQSITHILGGIICMNIILFLKAAEFTFGFSFLT